MGDISDPRQEEGLASAELECDHDLKLRQQPIFEGEALRAVVQRSHGRKSIRGLTAVLTVLTHRVARGPSGQGVQGLASPEQHAEQQSGPNQHGAAQDRARALSAIAAERGGQVGIEVNEREMQVGSPVRHASTL
jgi:hypothetical protein